MPATARARAGSQTTMSMTVPIEGKGKQLYIGGEWVDASGDEALDVINPATEGVIAQVPQATVADVDRAVAAGAVRVFDEGPWPWMSARRTFRTRSSRFIQAVSDRRAHRRLDHRRSRFGVPDRASAAVRHAAALCDVVRRAHRELSVPRPAAAQRRAVWARAGRDPEGADRCGRGDHAVQLPAVPQPREGRARGRDGQQRGARSPRR